MAVGLDSGSACGLQMITESNLSACETKKSLKKLCNRVLRKSFCNKIVGEIFDTLLRSKTQGEENITEMLVLKL